MENEENKVDVPESTVNEEKIRVIVTTPEMDKHNTLALSRIQKLIEAKEVKVIETRKALIEQGNINEIDLKTLLTKDDQEFYNEKKIQYLKAYPDLENDPFDMDDLHQMIMEQIIQRTLLRKKKKAPTADISKEYAESVKRQGEAKRSLSMRRTDRIKDKNTGKKVLNIASLSLNFSDADRGKILLDRIKEMRKEEEYLDNDEEKVSE